MYFIEILDPSGSELTIGFCIVILTLFSVSILRWRRLASAQKELDQCLQSWMNELPALNTNDGYQGLENELDRLESRLNSQYLSLIKPSIRELKSALFQSVKSNAQRSAPQIAYSAAHFFGVDRFMTDVLTPTRSRLWLLGPRTLEAMPSLFTALGILGTFIGLVGGLSETSADGMPDLQLLVGGLHTSFKSSIYGLIASLTITMYARLIEGRVHTTIGNFTDRLDQLLKQGTEHEILVHILKHQRESSRALKTLKDDLCESMSIAIRQELAPVLSQAFDQRSGAHLEGVSRIAEQVTAHLGDQLEQVARRFESAAEKVSAAGNFWEQVASNLATLTQQQRALANQLTSLLQPLNESVSHLQQTARQVAETTQLSHDTHSSLSEASSLMNTSLQTLDAQMRHTLESAQVVSAQFAEVAQQWSTSSASLQEVAGELNRGFEIFVGQFPQAIENTMQDFDRELAKVADRLVGASHDLQEGFDEVSSALHQVLQTAQSAPALETRRGPNL